MSPFHGARFARSRIDHTDVDAQLARLPPEETAALGPRATLKRRAELAAGRRAAHAALALLAGGDAASWLVVRTRDGENLGEPVVVGGAAHVSITHAGEWALAAASRDRIGIDLTPVEARDPSFAREAFVEGELERWCEVSPSLDVAMARAFSAKEAVLKWRGVGFGAPLLGLRVTPRKRVGDVVVDGLALAVWEADARQDTTPVGRALTLTLGVGALDDSAVIVAVSRV